MRIRGQRLTTRHLNPLELAALLAGRPGRRRLKVNTELRFLNEVVGLDRLNYGLWDGENADLEGLQSAQRRYGEVLAGWIPEDVEAILDIGCGVGTDTRELARRGYSIEGLSPDPYQQQVFEKSTGLPFHLSRLQDFEPPRRYDLALMSESAQYVWLDSLFPAIKRVAGGGYLLLADYFTVARGSGPEHKSGHYLPDFMRAATDAGLALERQEDVTDRVLPTLQIASRWMQRFVGPSAEILADSILARHPQLGKLFVKRGLSSLADLGRILDPDVFSRSKRYLFQLFRLPRV